MRKNLCDFWSAFSLGKQKRNNLTKVDWKEELSEKPVLSQKIEWKPIKKNKWIDHSDNWWPTI